MSPCDDNRPGAGTLGAPSGILRSSYRIGARHGGTIVGRVFALFAAFCLFLGGVWAVATTTWTVPTAVAATPSAVPTTAAPLPTPSSSATPAVWTQSTLRTYLVAALDRTDRGV